MKKFVLFMFAFLLICLALAFAVPYFYQDQVKAFALKKANEQLQARLTIGGVKLSVIKTFPDLNVHFDDLVLVGKNAFEGDTILNFKSFDASLDLKKLWQQQDSIALKNIDLKDSKINLIVLKNGLANWDVLKVDSSKNTAAPETQTSFKLNLKAYSLTNCDIVYDDAVYDTKLQLLGVNHSGKGDFTQDDFVLETTSDIKKMTLTYANIDYFKNVRLKGNVPIGINLPKLLFQFDKVAVQLNDLMLDFEGKLSVLNDIDMDFKMATPQSDFKSLLSLIPAIYAKDFDKIKTSGKFKFNGMVKGIYNDVLIPTFDLKLLVDDGFFQYPALPQAVKDINFDLHLANADGNLNSTVVDFKTLHANVANNPIDGKLMVKNINTDPNIDAVLKGKIDMNTVKSFYPLDQYGQLEGVIVSDLAVKGNLSDIENQRFDKFVFKGIASTQNFIYKSVDLPQTLKIGSAKMSFTPQKTNIESFSGSLGTSDLEAQGSIDNLLFYLFKNQALKGEMNTKSNTLNINELMKKADTNAKTDSEPATESTNLAVFEVPKNIDFTVNAFANRVLYDNLDLKQVQGTVQIKDEQINFKQSNFGVLGGKIEMVGTYSTKENIKKPAIDLDLSLLDFDVKDSYKTFVTMKKLAPIAQFVSGIYSTNFHVKGNLGSDMTPLTETFDGGGFIKVPQAQLGGYKPMEILADALQIEELKRFLIEKLNLAFEFKNGRVYTTNFPIKIKDMALIINGSTGIDQTINYDIDLSVPRSKLPKANQKINTLLEQAKTNGINLELSETVVLKVKMGGTMTKPDVKIDLKDLANKQKDALEQQAKKLIDEQKKILEQQAKKELEQLKQQANKIKEDAQQKANQEIEKLKQEAQQKGQKAIDSLNQTTQKLKEDAQQKANQEIEKLKQEAEQKAKDRLKKLFKNGQKR